MQVDLSATPHYLKGRLTLSFTGLLHPKTSLNASTFHLKQRMILVPAACTAHCPFVSSPLPLDSPAVAGCSASDHGCSRRLWRGCLLCSRGTETPSHSWRRSLPNENVKKRLPLRSWCCLCCSLGWSWKEWQSSCWSCLFAASQLIKFRKCFFFYYIPIHQWPF